MGARYEAQSLQRFDESKRYAILIVFLTGLSQELIDFAIEIELKRLEKNTPEGAKAYSKSIYELVIIHVLKIY